MLNRVEDDVLGYLDNKHRRTARVIVEQKKARNKRTYPEFTVHKNIAEYCAQTFIPTKSMWHTTENSAGGGVGAASHQSKLKVLGAKSGFPDGMIIYNNAQILFIEIKSEVGVVSEVQKAMHELLGILGFPVEVVRSLDEFIKVVKKYNIPTREHVGFI